MSTGCQIKEQNALHYITLQVVYWVDIFTRKTYRDLVVKSETNNLSDITRDFKKFTSKFIFERKKLCGNGRIIRYNSSYEAMEDLPLNENYKFSYVPSGNTIDRLAAQNIKLS
jgi:hypothetical protein